MAILKYNSRNQYNCKKILMASNGLSGQLLALVYKIALKTEQNGTCMANSKYFMKRFTALDTGFTIKEMCLSLIRRNTF